MAVPRRRMLPPLLIAGILVVPAISARAQVPTTTTTEETTTTTTEETTTTTAEDPEPQGSLQISAPSSSQLSPGTPTSAGTLSAQLGAVTVTDTRGAVNGAWTVTVSSTDFTTGDASASETIERADVAYASGAAHDVAGVGVFTPGQATADDAQSLVVSRTAFSMASGVGDTAATWNPTIVVTIPASAVTGTYSGTITHSAA